jgi:hypothetical protein
MTPSSFLVQGLVYIPDQLPHVSPVPFTLPGLPWPSELVEVVVTIMKQHQRILDLQLCTCSLLLRILGQGGCRPGREDSPCASAPTPLTPGISQQSVLYSAYGPPSQDGRAPQDSQGPGEMSWSLLWPAEVLDKPVSY